MITAKQLQDVLKKAGVQYISFRKGYGQGNTVAFKDFSTGKKMLGIMGGSFGPITVTNAHIERTRNIATKTFELLTPLCCYQRWISDTDFNMDFDFGKKIRTIAVRSSAYQTYANNVDLDRGYQTIWLEVHVVDNKK